MRKILYCLLALMTLGAGTVTAVSCGNKGGDTSAETSIDENAVSLRLTKTKYDIEEGQTVALQIKFTADGEDLDVSLLDYESSDESIATVDGKGTVTGVSGGQAYITASYGSKKVKATLNVTARENRVTVSDESVMLLVGTNKQVAAKAYFGLTELTDATLSWQSSNAAVATVENGLITAVGSGKAEIAVSYEGVTQTMDVTAVVEISAEQVNTFDEKYVNVYGRSYITSGDLGLDHAANGVEIGVVGDTLKVTMYSQADGYMRVFSDGIVSGGSRMAVSKGSHEYVFDNLGEGLHVVRIVKCTEEQQNANWDVKSFTAEKFFAVPEKSGLKIEFIGDSITAGHGAIGYGDEQTIQNSDATKAYAYLTAHELRADYSVIAASGICTEAYHWLKSLNMKTLYNQISSSNTKPYAFDFDADVVVVNLGTNEASYIQTMEGGAYGEQFPTDYQEFLEVVREKNPDAYIICLYGMGEKNYAIHAGIQKAVEAMRDEKIAYNPFVIEGNGAGGNGHPNSAAHKKWAEDLTAYIQTLDINGD